MSNLLDTLKGCGAGIALFVAVVVLISGLWWLFAAPEPMPKRTLTAEAVEGEWPLTTRRVTVACEDSLYALAIHEGERYALNGAATSAGYQAVNPLWKDDTGSSSPKVDLTPVKSAALDLCN